MLECRQRRHGGRVRPVVTADDVHRRATDPLRDVRGGVVSRRAADAQHGCDARARDVRLDLGRECCRVTDQIRRRRAEAPYLRDQRRRRAARRR